MKFYLIKSADESTDDYICRVAKEKDSIGTWDDVASFLNEKLGMHHGESYYRKKAQGTYGKRGNRQKSGIMDEAVVINDTISNIEEKKRELEIAKIQFRDERNAWNKQNRIEARVMNKLDILEEELKDIMKKDFPSTESTTCVKSDNDLLVMLSDFHIGQCFSSEFGEYNPDIAWLRLDILFREITRIKERHNCENCYISLMGDLISGNIHKTVQVTNSENVIKQIKMATELISNFCYELCKIFDKVYFTDVTGNHSRIDRKEDAIHDERLDSLVSWVIEKLLSNVDNFVVLQDKIDSGISMMNIRDNIYVSVHGDYDSYSKPGLQNLISFIGFIPYAVLSGHMHTCALTEQSGVKMIRGGSLSGSGDQYTTEKRLKGNPSQMVCVCNNKGVQCCYPVDLKIS